MQFSLVGNRVAVMHLATHVSLPGNHIRDEQWEKVQKRTPQKIH